MAAGFIPSTGAAGGRAVAAEAPERVTRDQPPAQILIDRLDGNGPKAITSTAYSHRNASVSPDGRFMAFVADGELRPDEEVRTIREEIAQLGTPQEREDATRQRLSSDIFVIPVEGGAPRSASLARQREQRSLVARLALARLQREHGALHRVGPVRRRREGRDDRNLTSDLRADPGPLSGSRTMSCSCSSPSAGATRSCGSTRRPVRRQEVISGRRRISGFTYDKAKTKVAYVATAVDRPTELFVANIDGSGERQLTQFNEALNKEIAWSPAERFTYTSVERLSRSRLADEAARVPGGQKYPLVLYIHGGPHSAYGENWFDEFQNIAGAGMWVLYTNPRGSSGYGGASPTRRAAAGATKTTRT
jgi:dipeptidyl aminopeptidase/acylaminoacyl peptidase